MALQIHDSKSQPAFDAAISPIYPIPRSMYSKPSLLNSPALICDAFISNALPCQQ